MADLTADYIVVGGGLTGCVIASRLSKSEEKPKVVLIEAGTDPTGNQAATGFLTGLSLVGGEYDYVYKSEPDPNTANRVHDLHAGKVLGGGSIINFGGWLRADAGDYDEWARMVGDNSWSHKEFKPWLQKVEHFHESADGAPKNGDNGFDGPMHVYPISASTSGARKYLLREPVKQAWTELSVPLNLRKTNGSIAGLAEFCENADPEGMRQPSYKVYPLDDVQVLTNTAVSKVIFSDDGTTTTTGVEIGTEKIITARKEVILCAGAYRTPQLLMLSGVGPAATLAEHKIPVVHDSPHVGGNLHDHFAIYLAFRLRDPAQGYALGSAHPVWTENPALFKYLPWDWIVSEPAPADIVAKHPADLENDPKRVLSEIILLYVNPGIPGIANDGSHIATSTMLLRPTSRGSVTIRSANPADPPRIVPNYFSTALDRDVLVHATRRTLKALLATEALAPIIETETPPQLSGLPALEPLTADASDAAIEERIRGTGTQHAHSGGTAAMGTVVDSQGRVLGVKRLRVADASIIPIPLGGHPQATLYAMAERLASLVLGEDS
ncbi:choline dehydrogenase [Apodospora peruviana]|uniref:Choline dehydrogenase n=1 Tax=Apodospora peruviana TaxID=516989 RepID=A0AAE0LZF0_9PEZI|nr:choline dehydrogenase [Apodospora peruviana]